MPSFAPDGGLSFTPRADLVAAVAADERPAAVRRAGSSVSVRDDYLEVTLFRLASPPATTVSPGLLGARSVAVQVWVLPSLTLGTRHLKRRFRWSGGLRTPTDLPIATFPQIKNAIPHRCSADLLDLFHPVQDLR